MVKGSKNKVSLQHHREARRFSWVFCVGSGTSLKDDRETKCWGGRGHPPLLLPPTRLRVGKGEVGRGGEVERSVKHGAQSAPAN